MSAKLENSKILTCKTIQGLTKNIVYLIWLAFEDFFYSLTSKI